MTETARNAANERALLRIILDDLRDETRSKSRPGVRATRLCGDRTEGIVKLDFARGGDYALKFVRVKRRDEMRSFVRECDATEWASKIGVGPKVALAVPSQGALITEFLSGGSLRPSDLRGVMLKRVAHALRTTHDGPKLPWSTSLRGEIEDEFDRAKNLLDPTLRALLKRNVSRIWKVLESSASATRPCHRDPHPGNLFAVRNRVKLIDWAAAGMDDPSWDLGAFGANARLGDVEWAAFLRHYLKRAPTPKENARARLMGVQADVYNLAWYTNAAEPRAARRTSLRLTRTLVGSLFTEWLARAER